MSLPGFQPAATLSRGASPYGAAVGGRRHALSADWISLAAPDIAWEAFSGKEANFLSDVGGGLDAVLGERPEAELAVGGVVRLRPEVGVHVRAAELERHLWSSSYEPCSSYGMPSLRNTAWRRP
jgi:hypothetical protein